MKNTSGRQLLSALIVLLFSLTSLPISLRSEVPETTPAPSLSLSSLSVPEELGKVSERFTTNSTRTIIQIQDVHAHAVAQQNIAAILERLRTVFGIETAALEGAWSFTSLPKSHAIPTSREKQLLATTLLEADLISGPLYAAIMSPAPILLAGVEDEALYEKNRQLFLAHLAQAPEIKTKLVAYGQELRAAQQMSWNPELLTFAESFGKFRDTSDLAKFLPLLLKTTEAHGAVSSDLAQVLLLRDTMTLEKSFDKERLEAEVKQVIKKYRDRPWTVEELIRGGKIPAEEVGLYPEIKKLTRLYQMRDQVSLKELMDQIGTLTRRVLETLIKTPDERALWGKTERFYLAQRILLLQATPEDIKSYDAEKALLEAELATAGLSEFLTLSVAFYETVKKRDEIFFEKIMNDPAFAGNIAIVTGGFHTDGLSQKFRDAGVSFITISPDLGGTSANEKLYNERMAGNVPRGTEALTEKRSPGNAPLGSQTLSELQNAPAEIDERFLQALEVLFQTKDVRKALSVFRGEPVAVSKNDKIRDLASRKRFRENRGAETVSVLDLKVDEFMSLLTHEEQLETVRALNKRAENAEHRPALISSVNALVKIAEDPKASALVEKTLRSGNPIALLKDGALPGKFLSAAQAGRVKLFEVEDGSMDTLISRTPLLTEFIRHHPPVVVMNHYNNAHYPVLEEMPESLRLYTIITLSESLYRAARNQKFLGLLGSLETEILSQELSEKSV